MTRKTSHITSAKIASFLAKTELFAGISTNILKQMAKKFEVTYLAGDEILFQEKDYADALYVVMYGLLNVTQQQENGQRTKIAEMAAGSAVGEIACFIDIRRTATVYAVRDSILLKMTRETFDEFLEKYPTVIMRITRQSVKRLVEPKNERPQRSITCFTLIPASGFANLDQFSQLFANELAEYGNTLLLNEQQFDERHGKGAAQTALDSAKSSDILSSIQMLEAKHRFIVYVAHEMSEWSQRCLRQADKIILVGQLTDSPQLNDLEQFLFTQKKNLSEHTELVLLSKQSLKQATGAKLWLNQRKLVQHYNIRENNKNDFARFIRLCTGNALGLVMSGGGARALGQLGVIRALEELKIPIDYIGGTSMGALIGGSLALELDSQTTIDKMDGFFNQFSKSFDYTLPISAVLKAKYLRQLLRDGFGEQVLIEELWQKYFCVSTNLSHNDLFVHEESFLWQSIRASISLPAIFPAVHDSKNHIHVDGGILNNLPVDVMQERINGGKILASSLQMIDYVSPLEYEEDTVSGWYLFFKHIVLPQLWQNWSMKKKNFVTIGSVMHNSMILGSNKHQQAMVKLADYNVLLDIKNLGLLNFKPIREMANQGYQQAMAAFEQTDIATHALHKHSS